MNDVPGAEGNGTVCPVCDSENVEELGEASAVETLEYRCRDCDTEFDESGGRLDLG